MEPPIRERASILFGALSHETRLRIIELLLDGGKTVTQIQQALGITQSGTSQHLAILARTGVLAVEQQGTSRIYRLRGPRIPRILELIEEFCQIHQLYGAEGGLEDLDPERAPGLGAP